MADVTSNSTFRTRTVIGNKRLVVVDIPGGGTTEDLIIAPLRVIETGWGNFRGSTVGSSSAPVLTIDGTTVNINQLAATTGAAYTVTLIGR